MIKRADTFNIPGPLILIITLVIVTLVRIPFLMPDTSFNSHSYKIRLDLEKNDMVTSQNFPVPGPFHMQMVRLIQKRYDNPTWAMHAVTIIIFLITCLILFETIGLTGAGALDSSVTVMLYTFLPVIIVSSISGGTVFYISLLQIYLFYSIYKNHVHPGNVNIYTAAFLFPLILLFSPDALLFCLPIFCYMIITAGSLKRRFITLACTVIVLTMVILIFWLFTNQTGFQVIRKGFFTIRLPDPNQAAAWIPLSLFLLTMLFLLPIWITAESRRLLHIPGWIIRTLLLLLVPAVIIPFLLKRPPIYSVTLAVTPLALTILTGFRSNSRKQKITILTLALLALLYFCAARPLPSGNRVTVFINNTMLRYTWHGLHSEQNAGIPVENQP